MTHNFQFTKYILLLTFLGFFTFSVSADYARSCPSPSQARYNQKCCPSWDSSEMPQDSLRESLIKIREEDTLDDRDEAAPYFQDWYEELERPVPHVREEPFLFEEEQEFQPIDFEQSPVSPDALEKVMNGDDRSKTLTDEEIEQEDWRVDPDQTLPLYTPGQLKDVLLENGDTEEEAPDDFDFYIEEDIPDTSAPIQAEEAPASNGATQPSRDVLTTEPTEGDIKLPIDATGVQDKDTLIYDPESQLEPPVKVTTDELEQRLIKVNFPNIKIVELIRYISRESGKNFIFNENELQFSVTIISEEDTSVENLMTALLQELRIYGHSVIEEGNNVIIYRNEANMNAISKVVDSNNHSEDPERSEIITRVFRLNTLDGDKAAAVLEPLTSEKAIINVLPDTNHIVVTDLTANIERMAQLLSSLDSPKSGVVIGQYVVKSDFVDVLINDAQRIMEPIAQEQTLTFVPHFASNSIFIVSTPYLVEKALQVLRYLDQSQGTTSLLDTSGPSDTDRPGWRLDEDGNWIFRPGFDSADGFPPNGQWLIDKDGNWYFSPYKNGDVRGLTKPREGEAPSGTWGRDEKDGWVYQLEPGQTISAKRISRTPDAATEALPLGHIERTRFSIFKLKYRKGDQVSDALRNIGSTLSENDLGNKELINTINSVQWIESSNSLIFTGTPIALQKVSEFIGEIDIPLRQVFIEVLILEMTLTDSLQYGVNWGTQLGGGNTALSETFSTTDSQIANIMNSGDISAGTGTTPAISGLASSQGYRLGIMGQRLTRCGVQFDNIAALVKAVHEDEDTRVLLNPKVFTEDNNPAELFVGLEVQFPTQSISTGDINNTITQNFETKEVGTKLTVTPQIGNNDVITLDIYQEHSNIAGQATQQETQSISTAGKTTTKSSTKTRVHVPNGFFVVLSGQIENEETRSRDNVPCLGGAPIIGGIFAEKSINDRKRNLMIFIRPSLVNTEEQLDNLTQHQQDIYKNHSYYRKDWEYEVDEALDLLNLKDTSPNGKQLQNCFSD